MLQARYLRAGTSFEHQVPNSASRVWREIVSAREALCKGACFLLGNGLSFDTRRNPWVSRIRDHIPKLKEGVDGSGVCCAAQIRHDDGSAWNMDLLNNLCDTDMMELICKVPWSGLHSHDKLLWCGLSGRAQECYEIAHGERFNQEQSV